VTETGAADGAAAGAREQPVSPIQRPSTNAEPMRNAER